MEMEIETGQRRLNRKVLKVVRLIILLGPPNSKGTTFIQGEKGILKGYV